MMELLLNGLGPKALIFERREEIITLGGMVAEEFFNKTAPVITLKPADFHQILSWDGKTVYIRGSEVSESSFEAKPIDMSTNTATNLNQLNIQLSDFDREALEGLHGETAWISMRVIIRMANMMGARELLDVEQAHADPAWYGPGSLHLAERLRDLAGKVRVPTTVNSINVDQRRWRALGVDVNVGEASDKTAKAFIDMGCQQTFTCASYLLDTAPKVGSAVAWGESNAVLYANSVLGARTLKNPNILEFLIALTGRAPKAGAYVDENRLASLWIRVKTAEGADDSFWPILGNSLGAIATTQVPVITGLEDLKAFAAAFATSSSAPLFHIVNVTPEASTLEVACPKGVAPDCVEVDWRVLESCWNEFNQGSSPRQVDLISFGNPHFSFQEIKKAAQLCRGKTKHKDVAVIVTCGRAQHGLAIQAGFVEELGRFGVQFLLDTCWCSIEEPVIPKSVRVIMKNSGKYIHYGPGLTGRQFCFGSLEMCIGTACTEKSTGAPPAWLKAARAS